MARSSVIQREIKRRRTVERYADRLQEIKTVLKNPNASEEERTIARARLDRIPRDALPVRLCNRCHFTGRGHGIFRDYGLSRMEIRKEAMLGNIPGLRKASW